MCLYLSSVQPFMCCHRHMSKRRMCTARGVWQWVDSGGRRMRVYFWNLLSVILCCSQVRFIMEIRCQIYCLGCMGSESISCVNEDHDEHAASKHALFLLQSITLTSVATYLPNVSTYTHTVIAAIVSCSPASSARQIL